jgi:hypothetical protein
MDWTTRLSAIAILIALAALCVSILAMHYTRRQTLAAEAQANEARLAREAKEGALRAQAADTAKALEIAARDADAAQQSAEAMKRLAGAAWYRNTV